MYVVSDWVEGNVGNISFGDWKPGVHTIALFLMNFMCSPSLSNILKTSTRVVCTHMGLRPYMWPSSSQNTMLCYLVAHTRPICASCDPQNSSSTALTTAHTSMLKTVGDTRSPQVTPLSVMKGFLQNFLTLKSPHAHQKTAVVASVTQALGHIPSVSPYTFPCTDSCRLCAHPVKPGIGDHGISPQDIEPDFPPRLLSQSLSPVLNYAVYREGLFSNIVSFSLCMCRASR